MADNHRTADPTPSAAMGVEERYRTLFDTIDEGFCVFEMLLDDAGRPVDYRFLEMNPAFERHTGLTGATGRTAREMVPNLEDHWVEVYGQVALTGQSTRFVLGSEAMGRWFEVGAFPIGAPGKLQVALLFNDITERKRAENALRDNAEQLRRQAEQLKEQDRNKNHFLGLLGHELRNPLAAVQNTVQWLRQGGGDDRQRREGLELIHRQGRHLLRLVDDLLNMTRISQGLIELQKTPLELSRVVAEAVDLIRLEIDGRRHRLDLDLPDEGLWLEADLERLVQVLSNLLGNAARYTPQGGRIGLRVTREGETAVIRVRDNGIGIAADQLARLFVPFTRLETPVGHRPDGLGLGLALAHQLVTLHGGSLQAASPGEGQGSEFTVRLPALAEHRPPVADPNPQPAPAGDRSRRILIIDDHEDVLGSMALLLQILGHEVHTLLQGREAVARVRALAPQVVFVDLGMPEISGFEVARQLRRHCEPGLILVALTGHGRQEDMEQTRAAGFDHHLLKPARLDDIQAVLACS